MAKLTRQTSKVFGSTSSSQQVAVFGSLAAGSPQFAGSDVAVAQSLANWEGGWPDAVLGLNSPAIEDLQAYCYVTSYQLAYLMQQGVPEYDGSTTYFQNSVFQSGGSFYLTTYGSAAGIAGAAPPDGSYYTLLYGVSPYDPGTATVLLGFGSNTTARPQLLTSIPQAMLPPSNRVVTSTTGTQNITASGSTNLTNCVASSYVVQGSRGVMVGLTGLAAAAQVVSGSSSVVLTVVISRDGTPVISRTFTIGAANSGQYLPGWLFSDIDEPGPGAHTYQASVDLSAGGYGTLQVVFTSLQVMEL